MFFLFKPCNGIIAIVKSVESLKLLACLRSLRVSRIRVGENDLLCLRDPDQDASTRKSDHLFFSSSNSGYL